jgi:nitrite reductase/ring-hydroxylating ferredoxin subunit
VTVKRSTPFEPVAAPIPRGLRAIGTARAPFRPALPLRELAPGMMRRATFGELDVLLAHTDRGVVAVDDRCPHMAAPLSLGTLEGCVVGCPLHNGRFDLASGGVDRMPTTGGLLPDGSYVPPWTPEGKEPKLDPPGIKAEARKLTRIRRFRYYPVRIVDGAIEVALPRDA